MRWRAVASLPALTSNPRPPLARRHGGVGFLYNRYLDPGRQAPRQDDVDVDPDGDLWMSVLEATGQPVRFE